MPGLIVAKHLALDATRNLRAVGRILQLAGREGSFGMVVRTRLEGADISLDESVCLQKTSSLEELGIRCLVGDGELQWGRIFGSDRVECSSSTCTWETLKADAFELKVAQLMLSSCY
jgi:hypothetical protein